MEEEMKLNRLSRVCVCFNEQGIVEAVNDTNGGNYVEWFVEEEELTYFLDFLEKVCKGDTNIVIVPTWG